MFPQPYVRWFTIVTQTPEESDSSGLCGHTDPSDIHRDTHIHINLKKKSFLKFVVRVSPNPEFLSSCLKMCCYDVTSFEAIIRAKTMLELCYGPSEP